MVDDPYITWLRDKLQEPGFSQTGLARHLGLDPASVNRIVNGKRRFKSEEITGAASYFGDQLPEPEVRLSSAPVTTAVVMGAVEAGNFLEVSDIDDFTLRTEIAVPADDRFPGARLLAFDVAGDSMNNLSPRPIFPGDRAICVAFEDVASQLTLRDGLVVVVQRTRDGGHLREWSIKQLELYEDRLEFHPRSTNQRHKPIIVPRNLHADDGVSVEIVAILRRIVNDFPLA